MKREFSQEEREAFFEQHFDYEADDAENKEIADRIFAESQTEVRELTERLSDGEAIDEPTFVLQLSNMILAHEYRKIFHTSGCINTAAGGMAN